MASAAAQIAREFESVQPKGGAEPEDEFALEVAQVLETQSIPVQRERKLTGQSGHKHRATLYVPVTESVLEPMSGHWNQVASAFTKFTDLGQANGYRLYTLLDDRQDKPLDDAANMMVQVSDVLRWTEQERWIETFLG